MRKMLITATMMVLAVALAVSVSWGATPDTATWETATWEAAISGMIW